MPGSASDLDGLSVEFSIPALQVPPAWMFAYETRLMDSWVPDVEQIRMPGFCLPEVRETLSVFRGGSEDLHFPVHSRNPVRFARRAFGIMDLGETLVFDARFDTSKNISHLVDAIAARIFMAQRILEDRLGECPRITVVLEGKAPPMARSVFKLLEIPVVITDRRVKALILRMPRVNCRPLYSSLFDREFEGYVTETPKKVLIGRRGIRSIANMTEVEDYLQTRDYSTVYFEDISVSEQWSIARNATEIVALHGAALSSLAFRNYANCPDQSYRLIEVFGAGYIVNMYRQIASVAGGKWVAVRGRATPSIVRDLDFKGQARRHQADTATVSIEALQRALDGVVEWT